jgi:hypothetical protein
MSATEKRNTQETISAISKILGRSIGKQKTKQNKKTISSTRNHNKTKKQNVSFVCTRGLCTGNQSMRKLPQQQQQPSSLSQQPTSSVQVDQLINQQTDKVFQVVNPINTIF